MQIRLEPLLSYQHKSYGIYHELAFYSIDSYLSISRSLGELSKILIELLRERSNNLGKAHDTRKRSADTLSLVFLVASSFYKLEMFQCILPSAAARTRSLRRR